MTQLTDPLLDEALRLFPAYQDLCARVLPGDPDPLRVDPMDVAEAFEDLSNDAVIRVVHLMVAQGYADTIFESGALLGRLYRMLEAGRRPRFLGEMGLLP